MERSERILIVDDEPSFVEAFRRTLEAKSYQVVTAPGSSQAQDLLGIVEVDLVVLGTMAPPGQAFAAHQWIRRHPRYRDVPLLVIDAPPEQRHRKGWRKFQGMQMEADEYVSKPVEPASLVPVVQGLLETARRTIKVLVADDHAVVRDGICAVVKLQRGMEVVGEAVDGGDAVKKALELLPHVVLMDIVMPEINGLEATRRIAERCPQARIIILTQYDEEENMIVARQAGAHGFIPKRAASAELVTGIRSVYAGDCFPRSFAAITAN